MDHFLRLAFRAAILSKQNATAQGSFGVHSPDGEALHLETFNKSNASSNTVYPGLSPEPCPKCPNDCNGCVVANTRSVRSEPQAVLCCTATWLGRRPHGQA